MIEITIFRPGPQPLRSHLRPPWMRLWWRRLWRKLPVHRAPREPGGTLFKAVFDARMVGLGRGPDRCDHDVCFEEYGGVIAGGLRYLGFTIVPDAIDVETIIQDKASKHSIDDRCNGGLGHPTEEAVKQANAVEP